MLKDEVSSTKYWTGFVNVQQNFKPEETQCKSHEVTHYDFSTSKKPFGQLKHSDLNGHSAEHPEGQFKH